MDRRQYGVPHDGIRRVRVALSAGYHIACVQHRKNPKAAPCRRLGESLILPSGYPYTLEQKSSEAAFYRSPQKYPLHRF